MSDRNERCGASSRVLLDLFDCFDASNPRIYYEAGGGFVEQNREFGTSACWSGMQPCAVVLLFSARDLRVGTLGCANSVQWQPIASPDRQNPSPLVGRPRQIPRSTMILSAYEKDVV